ncbi:hypothetical protein [Acetobacter persici]|uniref:SAM-dependent methyltransferase n=1 Tax=Acetobacter persici TaxID=1076596 RepID=A0A1U9LJQ0_9PROT|nr:hypothetical protein [Acetobacter persici]AQT06676.1 hypothetical protein A0U91_16865 [Acetobacter persici]
MTPTHYGNFTENFVRELASLIGDRRVLEVYAGNGYLASLLRERGVDIIATSLLASHDGHALGMFHDVEEIEASDAVLIYASQSDILLMSWPTTSPNAFMCAGLWARLFPEKPIFFIGEMPNPAMGPFGGLPGCASDAFFDAIQTQEPLPGYVPRNILDRAVSITSFIPRSQDS